MSYEIRILSDEDFEKLPYKHVKNSFGCADAKTGKAYVRHTGIKDIDRNTLEHEFDELLQKVSPHEEDGIRYKGFFDIFKTVLSGLSFIFPPLAPLATALNVGSTVHGISTRGFSPFDLLTLVPAGAGAFKGATNASAGFGSRLGGAFKGAVGFNPAKPLSGTGAGDIGTNAADFASKAGLPGGSTATTSLGKAFDATGALNVADLGAKVGSGAGRAAGLALPDFNQLSRFGAENTGRAITNGFSGDNVSSALPGPQSIPGVRGVADRLSSVTNSISDTVGKANLVSSLAPGGARATSIGPSSGGGPGVGFNRFNSGASSAGNALNAFGPSNTSTDRQELLNQNDVDTGLNNIDLNSAFQVRNLRQKTGFRGQDASENTALRRSLGNVGTSRESSRKSFVSGVNDKNIDIELSKTRAGLIQGNPGILNEDNFDKFVEDARKPNAPQSYKDAFALWLNPRAKSTVV